MQQPSNEPRIANFKFKLAVIFVTVCLVCAAEPCQVDYSSLPPPKKFRVGESTIPGGGLGMFAGEDIQVGSIVEYCPLLFVKTDQMTRDNILWKYVFRPTFRNSSITAVALGYCSMYNHATDPNIRYFQDCERMMRFIAIRAIKRGEEMFINYGREFGEIQLQLEYKK